MKLKNFTSVLLCLAILCGCRKKDNSPQTPAPPAADGSISLAPSFYGIFTAGVYSREIAPGTIYESNNCKAWVGARPSPSMNTKYSVTAGKITLNGDSLQYNSSSKYYQQNFSVQLSLNGEVWNVQGGNGIPAFTHTNTRPTPVFSGEENLPDSISKSAGVTIHINDVSGANHAFIDLMDDRNNTVSLELKPGNNTLTFSPQQLSVLKPTSKGEIFITLRNSTAYIYGQKDFLFQRENNFSRKLKIKE